MAAALGYGISLNQERTVLVVDVGGGTMHTVLVRLSPQGKIDRVVEVHAAQRGRPARCTVYRPDIGGLLPVYVADRYEGTGRVHAAQDDLPGVHSSRDGQLVLRHA